MSFPADFTWGAAAASYQIEGATQGADGGGESVWDMCCKRPGFVRDGDTGFVACDHYNRYQEDVALMQTIGLRAYRLSIMWPRVLPNGIGPTNPKGLDFYDRLVDALLAANITPWVTLYHWDYPRTLFERGGWLNADAPLWFEEYTRVIVDHLSDRVQHWFTLNEPACFVEMGHQTGRQAPGLQLGRSQITRVWHHVMCAHGRAVRAIRAHSKQPAPRIGFAPVFRAGIPASAAPKDEEAARRYLLEPPTFGGFNANWNLDPCFGLGYPADTLTALGPDAPPIRDGDMELIAQPLDFLGFNIYAADKIRAGADGEPEVVPYPSHHPRSMLGWPVTPEALYWVPRFLYAHYQTPIVITENGIALNDWVARDGHVHDAGRIDFMARYLTALERGITEGIPIKGYFHWSLMDNFEWAEGYAPRFGLIHVDYETQQRTCKDSAYWYRDLIAQNGALLSQPDNNP